MTTTMRERQLKADQTLQPVCFFSYVLQFDEDGSFYVGSSNAPIARFIEHAAGVGAKATAGKGSHKVRLIMPFLSRKEAEYNEKRMQYALDKRPRNLEALLTVFNRLADVVRPQKRLSELEREEREYRLEMQPLLHLNDHRGFGRPDIDPVSGEMIGFYFGEEESERLRIRPSPAVCGWDGYQYGTHNVATLKQMARDEDLTGKIYGRKVCRRCLAHAPEEREA